MKLVSQIVIITGASSGIGKAIATTLARNGATAILASRRLSLLEETVHAICEAGGTAIAIQTDLCDETSVANLIHQTKLQFGKIDALVSNAGIGYASPIAEIDADSFNRVMNVNVRGAVFCTKYILPVMTAQKSGTLVYVGSLASKVASPLRSVYVASKFALRGFAESVFLEARQHNIRVTNIFPGSTMTNFFELSGQQTPPADRLLTPQDIADMTLAALSLPVTVTVTEIMMRRTNDGFRGETE